MGFGIPLRTSAALGVGGIPSLRCAQLSGLAPVLDLIFTGGETLDSRITFTRSTTATRINSSGLIESVAINTPRFDYDPVTLAPKGLLIEERRTNLVLNSLIDGTILSTQIVTVSATAYTLSFYGTGIITLSGTHSATVAGIGAYPNRKTYTFTPTVGALTVTVSGTVQFAQLEAGSFATSFIPTAVAQVTREADVAVMTGTNFSSWYNPTQGTFYVETDFSLRANTGSNRRFTANDGTATNLISVASALTATATRFLMTTGGVAQVGSNASTVNPALNKDAMSYATNNVLCCTNAGTVVADTAATIPTVNQLVIGLDLTTGSSFALNGHLRRLAFFSRAFAIPELQALTA